MEKVTQVKHKPKAKTGTMSNQLHKLKKQIHTSTVAAPHSMKDPSPSPMKWKADGEDHINIWDDAATELGRYLAHNSELSFKHNIFGKFSSMENFWHYILSEERDDRLRSMRGTTLRIFTRKLTPTKITNFRAIIADSNYQRIKSYTALAKEVANSKLPFDTYFTNENNIRIRPSYFKWLIAAFEEIRKALRDERDPNFDFLLDNAKSTIYQYVLPDNAVKQVQAPSTLSSLLKEEVLKQNLDNN